MPMIRDESMLKESHDKAAEAVIAELEKGLADLTSDTDDLLAAESRQQSAKLRAEFVRKR